MSESNWPAPDEKPSGSSSDNAFAVREQQRPGLQQVSRRIRRQLVAAREPQLATDHGNAGADGVVGRVERHVRPRDPVGPQLPQRRPVRPHVEAADDRLVVTSRPAPCLERRRPLELCDPHLDLAGVVGRDVERRLCAVGETQALLAEMSRTRRERRAKSGTHRACGHQRNRNPDNLAGRPAWDVAGDCEDALTIGATKRRLEPVDACVAHAGADGCDHGGHMPPKPRQIKIEQRSALANMQALETKSSEELEKETKLRSAAQAILGARAAERFDAQATRAHFQKALAAARPQERMQLRRMADAAIASAERRPDDLKIAMERLGQTPPSGRQLLLLRFLALLSPPPGASTLTRVRGILIVVALVIAVIALALGIVELISLPFGGVGLIGGLLFWRCCW